ncbi:hypothetical protein [Streptomyces sp. NPDC021356]|uniref:hypothetical protein n=1 Tax=Streptomyces sp. NPDC021356 TaxID=3154900 RepID=UPI0033D89A03
MACHAERSAQVGATPGAKEDAWLPWSAPHGIVAMAMAWPFEVDTDGIAQRAGVLVDRMVAG